jgi:hypothetical protein
VVGDTPEAVELGGMRNVLEAAREGLGLAGGRVLWAPDGSGALPGWGRWVPARPHWLLPCLPAAVGR